MSFANNQGIRIHYEVEGKGPPLVMQYGQYFPCGIWREYHYIDALKNDFQLILVDARGHGRSDKPHDPEAYRIEEFAGDIIAVLDTLGLPQVCYMGYSSGGFLGFALAKYAPERFRSFILGGTCTEATSDDDSSWSDEQIQRLQNQTSGEFVNGLEGFLDSQNFPPLSRQMHTELMRHDPEALIAWLRGSRKWPVFWDVLPTISVPCLLYAGSESSEYAKAELTAKQIPGAVFVGIPGGGHLEGGTWINILKPHILSITARD
jgi:pimeloyl-ACP methyl ester carboxylesterase